MNFPSPIILYNVRLVSCWLIFAIIQSCNHTIECMTYMATLDYGPTPIVLSSLLMANHKRSAIISVLCSHLSLASIAYLQHYYLKGCHYPPREFLSYLECILSSLQSAHADHVDRKNLHCRMSTLKSQYTLIKMVGLHWFLQCYCITDQLIPPIQLDADVYAHSSRPQYYIELLLIE